MDRRSLYEDDIYAWAQQQAATLRRLAETRRDLPNELDLENVAEEIEDVGKSELNRVESFLRQILIHLIKAASVANDHPLRHWEREVSVFHLDLRKDLTRSMRRKVDMDEAWRAASIKADVELDKEGDAIVAGLPKSCPFSIEEIADENFAFYAFVERLRPEAGRETKNGR